MRTLNVEANEIADLDYMGTDSLLDLYLTEMAQETLLTYDEEIALAKRIERGQQAQRVIHGTDYTAEEFARLQALAEDGQAARERLGRANTRLVVSIAKRYRGYGVPFVDLIQDGNEGLMRAVDKYDPRGGYRFSTYATWWIRQAITRSLSNHGRVIRIPVHMGDRMREMRRVAARLEIVLGRSPSAEEIAAAMNDSVDNVRQMMHWARQPLSLEQPVGEAENTALEDTIEDRNTPPPDELADSQLLNQILHALIDSLSAREARILRLRYGFEDGEVRTLQEVADRYGLSRERIRQVEREALGKLRVAAARYRLEQFLPSG